MTTRYVSYAVVQSVIEETMSRFVRDGVDGEGNARYREEKIGTGQWYIRLTGGSAVLLSEKPEDELKTGSRVKISVEAAPLLPNIDPTLGST